MWFHSTLFDSQQLSCLALCSSYFSLLCAITDFGMYILSLSLSIHCLMGRSSERYMLQTPHKLRFTNRIVYFFRCHYGISSTNVTTYVSKSIMAVRESRRELCYTKYISSHKYTCVVSTFNVKTGYWEKHDFNDGVGSLLRRRVNTHKFHIQQQADILDLIT